MRGYRAIRAGAVILFTGMAFAVQTPLLTTGVWTWQLVLQSLFFTVGITMGIYAFRGFDVSNLTSPREYIVAYLAGNIFGIAVALLPTLIFFERIGRDALLGTFGLGLTAYPLMIYLGFSYVTRRLDPERFLVVGFTDAIGPTLEEIEAESNGKVVLVNTAQLSVDELRERLRNLEEGYKILIGDLEFARQFEDDLGRAESNGTDIEHVPMLAERVLRRIPIQVLNIYRDYYEVLFTNSTASTWLRVFDVLISAIISAILLPVLLLSMLIVLLFDGRPIFFAQPRRGHLGHRFRVFKLRTMDEVEQPDGTTTVELTRSGRFLRKVRLNEIPQLINVLQGKMSLIGSRPDLLDTHEFCVQRIPFYAKRNARRPGITGHAQVSFRYVDSLDAETFARRLSFDLYYVKNASINLYLGIALRTAEITLFGRGS